MALISSKCAALAAFVALGLVQLTAPPSMAATMLGASNDGLPSIVYDYTSGEVLIDTEGNHVNTYRFDSLSGIFTGAAPIFIGGTIFTQDTDFRISENIFTPTLTGVHNLGPVAQPYLPQAFLLADQTLIGSLNARPDFEFDLVLRNTPEPSTIVLVGLGLAGLVGMARRRSVAGYRAE